MGRHAWVRAAIAMVGLTGLAGCEDTACKEDTDCATTDVCADDGVCRTKCTTSTDCLPDETCTAGGWCAWDLDSGPGDGGADAPYDGGGDAGEKCTTGNEATLCAPYRCNIKAGDADGTCYAECTGNTECLTGYVCESAACVAEASPALYVAIISKTTATVDLEITTPGPDIDAIEIVRGATSYFAKTVEGSGQGAGNPAGGTNNYTDVNDVLSAPDAIPGAPSGSTPAGSCSIDDPNRWWSMGDTTGWIAVSFEDASGNPIELQTGDVVRVWELSPQTCSDVTTERDDKFEVYLGYEDDTFSSATQIEADWEFIEMSATTGGFFTHTL